MARLKNDPASLVVVDPDNCSGQVSPSLHDFRFQAILRLSRLVLQKLLLVAKKQVKISDDGLEGQGKVR